MFLLRLRGDNTKTEQTEERERRKRSFLFSPRSSFVRWWETRPSPKKVKKRFPYVRIYRRPSSLSRVWLRFAFLLPKMKKELFSFSALSLSLFTRNTLTHSCDKTTTTTTTTNKDARIIIMASPEAAAILRELQGKNGNGVRLSLCLLLLLLFKGGD